MRKLLTIIETSYLAGKEPGSTNPELLLPPRLIEEGKRHRRAAVGQNHFEDGSTRGSTKRDLRDFSEDRRLFPLKQLVDISEFPALDIATREMAKQIPHCGQPKALL